MVYYTIRVQPNRERTFLRLAKNLVKNEEGHVFFLRKKLRQKKNGKWQDTEQALFPGYVFLSLTERLSAEIYWRFKSLAGFSHFLKQGHEISFLGKDDLALIQQFLAFGEVLGSSAVSFGQDQRIQVVSGPLSGLEGKIVSVDRRKRRAKILLDFDNKQVHLTLGFELFEEMVERQGQEYA